MLKCWTDIPGYHEYMVKQLRVLRVDGWGGYVLNEKVEVNKRNVEMVASTTCTKNGIISKLNERIDFLDLKGSIAM